MRPFRLFYGGKEAHDMLEALRLRDRRQGKIPLVSAALCWLSAACVRALDACVCRGGGVGAGAVRAHARAPSFSCECARIDHV